MSFTDQKPFIVTKEHLMLPWNGGKNGKYFLCKLCGYKFEEGDTVRWQYTNDVKGAGGNSFVCLSCDQGRDHIIKEMIKLNNLVFDLERRGLIRK